jgi:putative hemolysin
MMEVAVSLEGLAMRQATGHSPETGMQDVVCDHLLEVWNFRR